jgi:superfamily I DNA and RNA helicase
MESNPRTIVRGKAGTGKTIIAVERAKRLASSGKRVLFLCYNQLLAKHLKLSLSGDTAAAGVEVRHVHELYRDTIKKAGLLEKLDAAKDSIELFSEIYPRIFVEAALTCDLPFWDALVIDEAQDLLTPDNIDAFDLMLGAPGINRGQWHIFFDKYQNIYGTGVQDAVEARLREAQPTFDDLFENCRNTKQVAIQASIISGIDLAIEGAPDGLECDNIYCKSQKSLITQIEATVAKLLHQGVRPGDIAILSTRKRENSSVSEIQTIKGLPLVDASAANEGDLVFSTMHGFKGLERLVVLAIDMEGMGEPAKAMLHYAGLSRARGLLHTFIPESAKGAYVNQAAAFASRLTGSAGVISNGGKITV